MQVPQVGFLTCSGCEWCKVIEGLCQGVVLQPDSMVCSLAPEELGLSAGMQHGPYLLEDGMVEAFCDTIVL